jgi:hypothetical protein
MKQKCRTFPFVFMVSTDNSFSDQCYVVIRLGGNNIGTARNMRSNLQFAQTEIAVTSEADISISAV